MELSYEDMTTAFRACLEAHESYEARAKSCRETGDAEDIAVADQFDLWARRFSGLATKIDAEDK